MKSLRFIDLFCGIGGFRQALDQHGHSCVFSSDFDPDAQWVYKQNFKDEPLGDLTLLNNGDIPAHDILCGGFPCQPFSISGKREGFLDNRGTLIQEIIRIAKVSNPKVMLLENVRNYLTHDGGRTMTVTLELLREAGYTVFYQILNASDFAIPQKRERLFFVCFRRDLGVDQFTFPSPSHKDVALEDILLPESDPRLDELLIKRSDLRMKANLPVSRSNQPLRIGTVGKGGQGERVYSVKGHAITLSAYGGGIGAKTGMYLVGKQVRRLHPEECRRAMGFAEGFTIHPRRNLAYKQFGNSVVVPLVSEIVAQIGKVLLPINIKAA